MKKIWMMMLAICSICIFQACSDDDDNPTPQNPVSNVKIPSTAEIGTEIIVSGTGFAPTAQFTFKGTASSVNVSQVTVVSTGVSLTVPMSLTPGQYTLILKQDGEWELGNIELTAASLPIIGLEVPETGFTGQTINIGGNGYNETSKVYAETENGIRTELTVTDYQSGLSCTLPKDLNAGIYRLILAQNGGEWTLSEEFEVIKYKRLVKIGWVMDFGDEYGGEMESTYEVYYENDKPQSFKYNNNGCEINYSVEISNDQITLSAGEAEDGWEDAFYEGYVKNVILKVKDNLVQENNTTFYTWKKDIEQGGQWTYTNRYMKSYVRKKSDFPDWEYTFDSDNLVDVSGTSFEYDQTQKYTRPGVDIAALLCEFNTNSGDMGWLYSAFTGLLGEKSAGIPVSISLLVPDWDTMEYKKVTYELKCTYDDKDKYVTSISYVDGSQGVDITYRIDFTYEEVQ